MLDDNLKWQRDVQNHFSTMLGNPGVIYNFPDPGAEEPCQGLLGPQPRATDSNQAPVRSAFRIRPRNQGILS